MAAHQFGDVCGPDGQRQIGDVVAQDARGTAAPGTFGDHAQGTAQGRPAGVRVGFVAAAVVVAHEGAGAPLVLSVPPFHGLALVVGNGAGAV